MTDMSAELMRYQRQTFHLLTATVFVVGAVILIVMGKTFDSLFFGVALLASGISTLSLSYAIAEPGINRRIWGRFVSYDWEIKTEDSTKGE